MANKFWPADSNYVNAPFHEHRINKNGRQYLHEGVDLHGGQGDNVYAPKDDIIIDVEEDPSNLKAGGSCVKLRAGNGDLHIFRHLSKINVRKNDKVCAGFVIANIGGKPGAPGSGSHTTGSHLHWEVTKPGSNIHSDPVEWSGMEAKGKVSIPSSQQEYTKNIRETQHRDEQAKEPKPYIDPNLEGFDAKKELLENIGATMQSRKAIENLKNTFSTLGTKEKIQGAIYNSNTNLRNLRSIIKQNTIKGSRNG